MRLLSAAIVLSLIAVTASAQTPLRTLSPATGASHRIVPKQSPHLGPVPHAYSVQQRALAVQKFLNLTSTPTLGQPFTLVPSAPFIAGVGELDYGRATVWSGNIGAMADGEAVLLASDAGYVRVTFKAQAGKRYAFDCRISTAVAHLDYDISPGMINGTAPVGQDGHILIAMDKLSTDQTVSVSLYPDLPAFWVFFGCDVSPF